MKQLRYCICCIACLFVLCTAAALPVSAAGSQTWYFTGDDADGMLSGTGDYAKNMTKTGEGNDAVLVLAPGERVWFYADEYTHADVLFPGGDWAVGCWVRTTNSTESGTRITTNLHSINATGATEKIEGGYNTIDYDSDLQENQEVLNAPGFAIYEGGRFAIEILWSGSASGPLELHYNPPAHGAGNVTSPMLDPGYPLAEPGSLALLIGGLFIGGALLVKRRIP